MFSELKNICLSDKEARVYMAMLELGPATMLEIATKASINRPTAYVQIESLKKIGLASTQTKGTKRLFIAESPTQLEFILDREKKEIEQKKEALAKILPDLTTLFNLADEKPQVRFFEGKEGLLRMQEEFLKTKEKEILGIYQLDDVKKLFPEHHETYTPQRLAKKIYTKSIYTSQDGPVLAANDKNFLRESKFIPPEKMPISIDISIFDNNVAISSLRGKILGTIITDQEIAKSFRAIFYTFWKLSEHL